MINHDHVLLLLKKQNREDTNTSIAILDEHNVLPFDMERKIVGRQNADSVVR